MRLSIHHRTAYRFSKPQDRLVQMLRMTPQNTHDQTVASWRIDIDCDAKLREGRDGWGNAVTMLYAEGPLTELEIAISGEVLTSHSDGVLHGVPEPLPPAVFLRATDVTMPDPAIATFAAATAGGYEMLRALHRINAALHERFAMDRSRPATGLTAGEAFTADSATPRDLAHMFVVAARSLNVPARYVSGYSLLAGEHRPTPHGWAEAYLEKLGWVGFDPCSGLSPQEDYVRVASALDAAGAAPVAGSRLGEGEERLDVDVTVAEA
ncbi:transglutaminase [Sphingomonas sp. Leaf339]|uniref:transglutaminase family protein n=1 Tax=Sphingomonas sp. Leaf339 TaxID=1736343 RepID=UPI0006F8A5A0|nr:transglutaminase family protein [Sphingomonas sp. Leaf339]KQU49669.1 transglutaminase [Sphingomonas sp. Leaf339]